MFRLCLLNETLNVLFSSEVRTLVASLTEILVNGAHAPPSRPDPLATEADLGGEGEKTCAPAVQNLLAGLNGLQLPEPITG